MVRTAFWFTLLVLAGACAGAGGPAPVTAPAKPECNAYEGAGALAGLAEDRIIIFGEAIHGTNESPDALFGLACLLAGEGVPVLVGLEAEHAAGAELDAFLDHGDVSRLYETTAAMWDVHDGRSSRAILTLLQNLAGLRAAGLDVRVFAFDTTWSLDYQAQADWATVARDAKMAEIVNETARAFEGAVLLLTGGFHARKQSFPFDETLFVPMATGITVRPVLSLEMWHAGGSGWITGEVDGEPVTGAITVTNLLAEGAPARTFVLGEHEKILGEDYWGNAYWDGVYYTGPITASPPAFPSEPPP